MALVKDQAGCLNCPLRGNGTQTFYPDTLRSGAPVLVVTDTAGQDHRAAYAKRTGLDAEAFSLASALRCQEFTELPKLVEARFAETGKRGPAEEALEHCQKAHSRIPNGTKLIVTRGDHALWTVSALRSASSYRGWLVPQKGLGNGWRSQIWQPRPCDIPVLVHAPSADLLAQRMDWRKVKRVLEGRWPSRFPGFHTEPPKVWPAVSAFDTEFHMYTKKLTRFSLYDGGEKPWVIEAADVRAVAVPDGPSPTVFMHNVEADILHLERMLGPRVHQFRIEDTMLMHAVLWSDLAHDLEYLGSLYARTNRWKHLGFDSVDYSAGDALGTWDVAAALSKEMKDDPQSYWVYRNSVFPLTPIIMEAERVGLRLDQDRVQQALEHFQGRMAATQAEAEAHVGWPLQLSSPEQVSRWLYTVEKVGAKQKRKAKR